MSTVNYFQVQRFGSFIQVQLLATKQDITFYFEALQRKTWNIVSRSMKDFEVVKKTFEAFVSCCLVMEGFGIEAYFCDLQIFTI